MKGENIMKEYEYKEHKQGIYKCNDSEFEVVTLGNHVTKLTKDEIVCYLCADGATCLEEVKENICKYYRFTNMTKEELKVVVDSLVKRDLLIQHEVKRELHKHVSLNKNILKQLDIPVNKRTILSIADIEISITDLCPFDCSYCSKKENNSSKEYVTLQQWEKVLEDAYSIGANGVKLTGGEPLHPKVIDKTLALAKKARCIGYDRVVLLTSGFALADNIKKVVEAGITEISISYNMIGKFEEDRVRNSFVEKNFDKFLVLKEYNIKLNICCVVNQESVLILDEVLQFALDKGVGCIHFYPVMPVGGARTNWNDNKLGVDQLRQVFRHLEIKREELKDVINISAEQMFLSCYKDIGLGCEALNYWVYITEDGYVNACACSDLSSSNIKKEEFIDIWREAAYFEELRNFEDDSECKACTDRKYCVNNCYIRLLQAQKSGFAYDSSICKYLVKGGI